MRAIGIIILLVLCVACVPAKNVGRAIVEQERVMFPAVWSLVKQDPRDAAWDPDFNNGEYLHSVYERKLQWVKLHYPDRAEQ